MKEFKLKLIRFWFKNVRVGLFMSLVTSFL